VDGSVGRPAAGAFKQDLRFAVERHLNHRTVIDSAAWRNISRFQSWLNGVSATTAVFVVVR
jgi:hypothetical protein